MSDRERMVAELQAYLVRAGESRFAASIMAETIADAAEVVADTDRPYGDARTPLDYARGWMRSLDVVDPADAPAGGG